MSTTVLDAYKALAEVEAGLALLRPEDTLIGQADDLVRVLRTLAIALLPSVKADDGRTLYWEDLGLGPDDLVTVFGQWELKVLNGLRLLAGVYDRLDEHDQQTFWCAMSAVPQQGARGPVGAAQQQALDLAALELTTDLRYALRSKDDAVRQAAEIIREVFESSLGTVEPVSTATELMNIPMAKLNASARSYLRELQEGLKRSNEELQSLRGSLHAIYKKHLKKAPAPEAEAEAEPEAKPVTPRKGSGWQRLSAVRAVEGDNAFARHTAWKPPTRSRTPLFVDR